METTSVRAKWKSWGYGVASSSNTYYYKTMEPYQKSAVSMQYKVEDGVVTQPSGTIQAFTRLTGQSVNDPPVLTWSDSIKLVFVDALGNERKVGYGEDVDVPAVLSSGAVSFTAPTVKDSPELPLTVELECVAAVSLDSGFVAINQSAQQALFWDAERTFNVSRNTQTGKIYALYDRDILYGTQWERASLKEIATPSGCYWIKPDGTREEFYYDFTNNIWISGAPRGAGPVLHRVFPYTATAYATSYSLDVRRVPMTLTETTTTTDGLKYVYTCSLPQPTTAGAKSGTDWDDYYVFYRSDGTRVPGYRKRYLDLALADVGVTIQQYAEEVAGTGATYAVEEFVDVWEGVGNLAIPDESVLPQFYSKTSSSYSTTFTLNLTRVNKNGASVARNQWATLGISLQKTVAGTTTTVSDYYGNLTFYEP